MTQEIRFNHHFGDADTQWLCQHAHMANDPQHHYYTCGWMTGKGICSIFVQGPDFAEHLRVHHGVVGSDKASLMCCWTGCFVEMKKESLLRHVNERHLEFKYPCPHCPEQFTRTYTMQNHVTKKHSVS